MNVKRTIIITTVLVLALLVAANPGAMAAISRQTFDWIVARKLTVNSDATIEDDLTVNDDVTIGGDAAVTGASTAASYTATGAVQGEQITSTDDMTAAGTIQGEHLYSADDAMISDTLTVGDVTVTNTVSAEQVTSTDDATFADDVSVGGDADITGATTMGDDATLSELAAGNNAGTANQFQGLMQIHMMGVGAGTNPGSETVAIFDETPTGEVAEVDGGTNITITASTAFRRTDQSTNSVAMEVITATEDEGWDATIAEDNLTTCESIGLWIYSTEALTSGDIDVTLDDTDGTDQAYNIGAVSANTWTYQELDISACNGNCDTVDGVKLLFTAQGATNLSNPTIYVDGMWYWDAADEETLGYAILQDGILGVTDPADGTNLVEYTDYLVHYEDGNDFLVWITDQSAAYPLIMFAYD